jgi:hypothetical protein
MVTRNSHTRCKKNIWLLLYNRPKWVCKKTWNQKSEKRLCLNIYLTASPSFNVFKDRIVQTLEKVGSELELAKLLPNFFHIGHTGFLNLLYYCNIASYITKCIYGLNVDVIIQFAFIKLQQLNKDIFLYVFLQLTFFINIIQLCQFNSKLQKQNQFVPSVKVFLFPHFLFSKRQ